MQHRSTALGLVACSAFAKQSLHLQLVTRSYHAYTLACLAMTSIIWCFAGYKKDDQLVVKHIPTEPEDPNGDHDNVSFPTLSFSLLASGLNVSILMHSIGQFQALTHTTHMQACLPQEIASTTYLIFVIAGLRVLQICQGQGHVVHLARAQLPAAYPHAKTDGKNDEKGQKLMTVGWLAGYGNEAIASVGDCSSLLHIQPARTAVRI
jgi:hypothetical protein